MSHITITRLPPHVRNFVHLYTKACQMRSGALDPHIRRYLLRLSRQHQIFMKHKMFSNHKKIHLSGYDFPEVTRKALEPLFEKPLDLGPLEKMSVEELFKPEYRTTHESFTRIAPNTNKSIRNYTDYQASVIKGLAAYFSPLKLLPNTTNYKNMFQYFHRLLNTTPVVLFLKQKNRLLLEPSIAQINYPYTQLQKRLTELKLKSSSYRNYHLAELVNLDVLELAIKSQPDYTNLYDRASKFLPKSLDWTKYIRIPDKLCQELFVNKDVRIVNRDDHVFPDDPRVIFEQYPVEYLREQIELGSITDSFPYDIAFNNIYMLTIEQTVLHSDHRQLFELLESVRSEFELFGVRFDTTNALIADFLHSKSVPTVKGSSYEDMLRMASLTPSNTDNLFKSVGELGLTKVHQGCYHNCIYVL